TSLCFAAVIVLPGIDHHFRWSKVPSYAVAVGDVLVACGLVIIFFVFRENSHTSGVIEVETGQAVISTGPYHLVRHPMYAGAVLIFLGIPLALGSWWGLFICVPLIALMVWRLIDEERFLCRNLAGYDEYRQSTTYRLVPGLY